MSHRVGGTTFSKMTGPSVEWVVLTMGDRPEALESAVESLAPDQPLVVFNGSARDGSSSRSLVLAENLGVPGGRDQGVRHTAAEIVGFLDDDAIASPGVTDRIREAFDADPQLGALALHLVDEAGETSRRHVPRLGGKHPDRSGDVALFLGGACAIRRTAYVQVGGYYTDLFYGHEELELSWRLIDAGWTIRYLADAEVFHPRTTIERHPEGWKLTGRNRVMIARRTLPWPVALLHVFNWLVIGAWRAPTAESRRSYLAGWRSGWRVKIERSPISWRGVARLTRLGRPPVV